MHRRRLLALAVGLLTAGLTIAAAPAPAHARYTVFDGSGNSRHSD
jgi:hypothetical protein